MLGNQSGFCFLLLLGLAVACQQAPSPYGKFDPTNENQLVEIYTRSNAFNDHTVFDKYDVKGKAAKAYTDAIVFQSDDPDRWKSFLAKVNELRAQLEPEYSTGSPQEPK